MFSNETLQLEFAKRLLIYAIILFKVPVEEKITEPPKAAKKAEPAVVPPKEEPTKKEKGTFLFHI